MKSPVTPAQRRTSTSSKSRYLARIPLSVIVLLVLAAAVIGVKHLTSRREKTHAPASATTDNGTRPVREVRATESFTRSDDSESLSTATAGKEQPLEALAKRIERGNARDNTVDKSLDESSDSLLRADGAPNSFAAQGQNPRRNESQEKGESRGEGRPQRPLDVSTNRKPKEGRLTRAHDFNGDLRRLPRRRPIEQERRELEPPESNPTIYVPPGTVPTSKPSTAPDTTSTAAPSLSAPAPPPVNVFEGLDRFNWGAGSPPDTNGDVGPTYYIQTVNTSIGIFRKSDGFMEAAFSFNTFMSQGSFGNLCDTNNFGDPVVLYDTFDDRWIITDFAFLVDGGGNALTPAYQCFAASKTGNPLTGGWNFYSIQVADRLNDYPKFGIWPDGLYMSSNLFTFGAGPTFQGVRVWAFNKAQMYAGSPTVKIVSFDVGGGDFTILPSNARLQTGTPPVGRPNLYMSTQLFLNAVTVYKFHVDWDHISLSTFTGPDIPISATQWPTFAAAIPQPGTTQTVDSLSNRAMMQNQYTNFGGTESLWVPHTVRRGNTSGFAAPRWYQVNVTGGTVAASIPQAATWDPDGANVIHRWMPSLALDRAGNLAMGYSTSNATTEFPSIKYAGRLAGDPLNTFSQTEQTFFTGTASQTSSTRWGDYSAMTLDPNGCTFWYTTEYANPADQTFNHRWLTKFGSIAAFPGCTPFGAGGTVSGTVTLNPGGAAISGATVMLGARSTTTDGSGNYSFTGIPAGTYPSMSATKPGLGSDSANSIVVTDGNTTTQNFSLADAPDSSCITDTTQADFLTGVPSNVNLQTSPGDVRLDNPLVIDQQNTNLSNSGLPFTTAWVGQTFTANMSGPVARVDLNFFSLSCSAVTMPPITVAIRAATGNLPTGPDLATGTINGFCNGSAVWYQVNFAAPVTITAGTQYAIVWRTTLTGTAASPNPRYDSTVSAQDPYAGGRRATSSDGGVTWVGATGTANNDHGFKVYVDVGFQSSGNLISSPKDANPSGGLTPIWTTLSWNGSTPANTSIQFQVAGSNNVNGPFNFIGPDGTAGTFFTTSPANLTQFYNFRYIEYKAYLATTNSAVTPTLNDVTVCFNDADCSGLVATITPTPTEVCANSTGNTASGPAGMTTYLWGITNGTITSATNTQSITYTAGASGTTTLNLTVIAPSGCVASTFVPVTINPIPATPTITPGGPTTFCAGGSVALNSSSATGNQWYLDGNLIGGATGQQYIATTSGSYTVVVTTNGCASATSTPTVVTAAACGFSVQDGKAAEPATGSVNMVFTVTFSGPAPPGGASVNFTTQDQAPALNHAVAGQDYTATSGTVTFAAGQQFKTISVPVLADANLAEVNETFQVVLSNPLNGVIANGTATGTITQGNTAGTLLISELRTSGPGGPGDDFVELYNNTNSPLTVNGTSGGYGVYKMGATCADAPVLIGTIPNGTVISARGHYLLVGSAYSLANYGGTGVAAGDQTMSSDIEDDHNVAVFSTANVFNISSANRLDAVGYGANIANVCDLMREGNTLTPLSGTTLEHSYFRLMTTASSGNPQDSDNNAADFKFADTQGTITPAGRALGSPGPENLGSPRRADTNGVFLQLLDNSVISSSNPNRFRVFPPVTNGASGTLVIRRRVQNQTGAPVTRLRFRIVEMTTFPSPGAPVADLRALTSVDEVGVSVNDAATCTASGAGPAPCTVTVRGTTLEEPPTQANGGGYNSSLSVGTVTLPTPLAPGASVNVRFVLGVQQTGNFRFLIIVEALP